jgi:hypothetical protein
MGDLFNVHLSPEGVRWLRSPTTGASVCKSKFNTDKTIERHSGLDEHVHTVVSNALHRFGEQVTRVEVHLSDNLGQKSADGDNRCLMEARLTGLQPIAVSDHAATLHQAISGATEN